MPTTLNLTRRGEEAMAIDFGQLPQAKGSTAPTDPQDIFKQRPAGDQAANDLWQGQAEALDEWFGANKSNILINLNTGAGKNICGTTYRSESN